MSGAGAVATKTIFYDGVYTLAGRLLRTVLALLLSVLVARALGPHGRGLYALATAVYAGLTLAVFTGISFAFSYFMLTAGSGRGVIKPALLTGAVFSLAGAIPVAVMAQLAHNAWAILPAVLLLPANVGCMLILGYALGTKRIRWQTNYNVLSTAGALAAMTLTFAAFSHSANAAIAAYVAISLLTGAACTLIVLLDSRSLASKPVAFSEFLFFALRVGAANLVTLLNYRADLYVVALLATPSVLGQYAVAISAAESLLVVTQVAAVVTSPHVGAMGREEAAKLTATCVRATFVAAFCICAVLYVLAPYLVQLLYGAAYLPLVPALRVLLIAVLVLSLGSPISNFFTLNRGKPEVALASAACAACICVAVSWFLVPRIGMVGAAIATALAYFFGEGVRMTFFITSTGTRLGELLVPTRHDLQAYAAMIRTAARDVARVLSWRRGAVREL